MPLEFTANNRPQECGGAVKVIACIEDLEPRGFRWTDISASDPTVHSLYSSATVRGSNCNTP